MLKHGIETIQRSGSRMRREATCFLSGFKNIQVKKVKIIKNCCEYDQEILNSTFVDKEMGLKTM